MSDQINNQAGDGQNQGNIMKELSDIKTSLAVNTAETQFIKETVNEVKGVVKEMQSNYITQDQHKVLVDSNNDHETRIRDNTLNITKVMTWGSIATFFLGAAEVIIMLYYK